MPDIKDEDIDIALKQGVIANVTRRAKDLLTDGVSDSITFGRFKDKLIVAICLKRKPEEANYFVEKLNEPNVLHSIITSQHQFNTKDIVKLLKDQIFPEYRIFSQEELDNYVNKVSKNISVMCAKRIIGVNGKNKYRALNKIKNFCVNYLHKVFHKKNMSV